MEILRDERLVEPRDQSRVWKRQVFDSLMLARIRDGLVPTELTTWPPEGDPSMIELSIEDITTAAVPGDAGLS